MQVAVIGAGWSGMAAAVGAARQGHCVTVFEAARTLGGRARAVDATLPDGSTLHLDNGQHILIGAYTQTLAMMHAVGIDPASHMLRMPLTLQFPDGRGLKLPKWPSPLDALGGIWQNPEWTWRDKCSVLRAAAAWKRNNFRCAAHADVQSLCQGITPRVMQTVIEPLCVSALNTPTQRASGQVFLRVLKDALFAGRGGSDLLLPRTDLSTLFPQTAAKWLVQHAGQLHAGTRVNALEPTNAGNWVVNGSVFDAVILAAGSKAAAQLVAASASRCAGPHAQAMQQWAAGAQALHFEEIATVYAYAPGVRLPLPMLTLRSDLAQPAQFVFDRGQLGGPPGLLALVVSANRDDRETVQAKVLRQSAQQLANFLGNTPLTVVQTIIEKRATFACTPGLQRPPMHIAPRIWACGDYVDGPYPATLEGAVRSGLEAAHAASTSSHPTHQLRP